MKTILLPTDFSPNSINAIHYAIDLFKDCVCEFHILNVQKASGFISDDFRTMSPSTTIYQTLIVSAKEALKELITKLKAKQNKKHSFEMMVDYDNFIDAINQACALKKIELIVMGTKGATGAERILFGSNTVRVMQRCKTPVIAVPKNSKFSSMDRIAFTSNYLTHYKEEELMPLIHLAELFHAKIDILHLIEEDQLSEDQENNKAYVDTCFKFVTHEFVDLEKHNLFDTVEEYIKDNDIKLLAMMGRKHSFLERLFTKHNIETFGFKIDIPMLVMENTGKLYTIKK